MPTAKKKKASIFEGDLKKQGIQPEKDEFLEPEEHPEESDELEQKMRVGEKEEDIYTEEGQEELLDDDEIAPWEEGFSKGAIRKASKGKKKH